VPRFKDLTGKRFGKLTVTGFSPIAKNRRAHFYCTCDCGTVKVIRGTSLSSGNTRSCGCMSVRSGRRNGLKHGMTNSPEYHSWENMKARCLNKAKDGYRNYGGRGIVICKRWLHSFESFFADMGCKPSSEFSIDRINNDGNYEPGNCRWATPKQQKNNRRKRKNRSAIP
jgi:hypothetical protein